MFNTSIGKVSKNNTASFTLTQKLVLLVLSLLIFGIFIIYDSTFVYSQDIYDKPWVFAALQLGWIAVGLICFSFFYFFDYRKIKYIAYPLFLFSLLFLGILAIIGLFPCSSNLSFAPCINGANRWLYVPINLPIIGYIGFQPAELMKLALILYLSVQLSKKEKESESFFIYIIISLVTSGLILLQPNMSTAVMLFCIATVIYYVGEFSLKPLIKVLPVLFILGIIMILLTPYRRDRLMTFIQNKSHTNSSQERDLGEDYHVKQISIALGSGGLTGLGFGQSRQKYQYLPEVATDSIFAVIGEELGFIGTSLLLLFYGYFIYVGFEIAKYTKDIQGRLMASGIVFWMGIQFFVNVAAMTSLIPLTGVPLPLISYGGSSMLFSLMSLGVLANISKYA